MWSTTSGDRALEESSSLVGRIVPTEILLNLRNENNSIYLDALSRIALDPRLTSLVFTSFEPIFPDLLSRWPAFATPEEFAFALSTVLPVAPYLVPFAEHYLLGPGLGSFFSPQNDSDSLVFTQRLQCMSVESAQQTLLMLLRFLKFNSTIFSPLARLEHIWPLLKHDSAVLRYLSLQIATLLLNISDNGLQKLLELHCGKVPLIASLSGVEVDFRYFWTEEIERLDMLESRLQIARTENTNLGASHGRLITPSDTCTSVVTIAGIQFLRHPGSIGNMKSHVDTATAQANLKELARAVRTGDPILVHGAQGSGKTHYVHRIAEMLGASKSMISIHLGKQTDTKLLLGTYVSSEPPGTFNWKPGVLTTAVREGRWVLIEDLDQAPNEVLSLLVPLMQRRALFIPNRAETIVAPSNFRLIATVRTLKSTEDESHSLPPTLSPLGLRLWRRVIIENPSQDEIVAFIDARYPRLGPLSSNLVHVFNAIQNAQCLPSREKLFRGPSLRQAGLRELFNWCARMDLHISSRSSDVGIGFASEYILDMIFIEAIDCFAGHYQDPALETAIANIVASKLSLDFAQVYTYLTDGNIPTYKVEPAVVIIGRSKLIRRSKSDLRLIKQHTLDILPYAMHKYALRLLERVSVCVNTVEPVLLVGETGTGKTTAIQHLAKLLGANLTVHNFSQQTESSDLMGGFQPMDLSRIGMDMAASFSSLFRRTFSTKRNMAFLDQFDQVVSKKQWKKVLKFWMGGIEMASKHISAPSDGESLEDGLKSPRKRRKLELQRPATMDQEWREFTDRVAAFNIQFQNSPQQTVFSFVEGLLVKAVRNGEWVLLDELNLASPETLESIADLMSDATSRSMLLLEKGGVERIHAHPNFRIFGCMNPATDVGKRDLPQGIRSRFTEFFVPSPDRERTNVLAIVKVYLEDICIGAEQLLSKTTDLYLEIRTMAEENRLVDGAGQKPIYSIRTLSRTLAYVVEISPIYGVLRSLYEGFCMMFLTCLASESENLLHQLVERRLLSDHPNARSLLRQVPKMPPGDHYTQFKHYWMLKGQRNIEEQENYIITPYVEKNLLNLVRAAATRKYPVLIQGPTSSGKTSMIRFLASRTGHTFVRINNHEHTDLQEYLGSFMSDSSGTLKFQEGALIQAMRTGSWVILDELNLAPTDVLEALNRLLDDNREVLIPETQEVVRPHPDFMLFATQNPPGLYAGRKVLSKAFRNRFIELHFDDIPQNELQEILQQRTQIAPSFAARIVSVYNDLSILRQSSRLFEQKQSFATLRDLFRWANRGAITNEELAEHGYMLLAERVRNKEEKSAVRKVIETRLRVNISPEKLYGRPSPSFSDTAVEIVWTKAMARLFILLENAMAADEPVLLVGETGCGKTTVCQILALARQKKLEIVNAHMNTETGDIIGSYRPLRNRSEITQALQGKLKQVYTQYIMDGGSRTTTLSALLEAYDKLSPEKQSNIPNDLIHEIKDLRAQSGQLFEWVNGSLVEAMKNGDFFLLDEISLAEDSVLERLNSVLEPEREIFLAEKGFNDAKISAHSDFKFFATMNPGGDYGKKELSPALRNRFTEIWVPPMDDFQDVLQIAETKLISTFRPYATPMIRFGFWFNENYKIGKDGTISIRDVISWIQFCNTMTGNPSEIVCQGALMVYIDTLGSNPSASLSISSDQVETEREKCLMQLSSLLSEKYQLGDLEITGIRIAAEAIHIGAFILNRSAANLESIPFDFSAPTTSLNAMRVTRAMQVNKPILLEGAPGVGKTSLISAIAAVVGIPLVRINLSEETDIMDLFGTDVPAENSSVGTFVWREAPFLTAMQTGTWVLLDEMNLASQSVLEGLNSCLDHRKTVYIPELGKSFQCHPNFRLFAAQNPHNQGNGRKGLPSSFVNRFTVVYIRSLGQEDLLAISKNTFPSVQSQECFKAVEFSSQLAKRFSNDKIFGLSGAPWEFNLRDTLRWLEIASGQGALPARKGLEQYFTTIVSHRFRTLTDKKIVNEIFKGISGNEIESQFSFVNLSPQILQVGNAMVSRKPQRNLQQMNNVEFLPHQLPILETVLNCVNNRWPCLLVGASGSGKSSMIELVASAVGARIEVIPLNNDTETSDVIGSYEQDDLSRVSRTALSQIRSEVETVLVKHSLDEIDLPMEISMLLDVLRLQDATNVSLQEVLMKAEVARDSFASILPGLSRDLQTNLRILSKLVTEKDNKPMVSFAWYDGALVRAVENGYWVVLDNANLCNPSVLDRINSLLEHKGALFLHEHSSAGGEGRIITPHPEFRLFMTMDPKNGELSRAMRNRSIEVFVPSTEELGIDETCPLPRQFPNLIGQSQERTFAQINRLLQKVELHDPKQLNYVSYHILEETSLDLVPAMIQRLGKFASLNSSQNVAQSIQSAILAFQMLSGKPFYKLLIEFKEQLCNQLGLDSAFSSNQSIHPLSNQHILGLPAEKTSSNTEVIANLFSDLYDVAVTSAKVHGLLADLIKASETRYLSRQVNGGSSSNNDHDLDRESLTPLLYFLSNLNDTVDSFSAQLGIKDLDSQAKQLNVTAIGEIVEFIHFIAQLPSIGGLAFQACFERIAGFLNEVTGFWSDITIDQIRFSLKQLINTNGFGSGFSFTRLWKAMRTNQPNSEDGIVALKKLRETASRFDHISRELISPTSQILQLRLSFVRALNKIQRAESIGNLEIEEFDDTLHLLPRPDVSVTRVFHGVFDMLFRLQLLANIISPKRDANIQEWNTLAYHAQCSTESLHKISLYFDSQDAYKHFPLSVLFYWPQSDSTANLMDQIATESALGHFVKDVLKTSDVVQAAAIGNYASVKSDLLEFCKLFTLGVKEYHTNILCQFRKLLFNKILLICNIHESILKVSKSEAPFPEGFTTESLLKLLISSKNGVEERLSLVLQEYFIPSLQHLEASETDNWHSSAKLGLAWVKFSLGCLKLFVPNRPYDPALENHFNQQVILFRHNMLQHDLVTLERVTEILSGSKDSLRSKRLREKLSTRALVNAEPMFYRGQKADFEPLKHLLQRLFAFLHGHQIQRFLEKLSSGDPSFQPDGQSVRKNLRMIFEQVKSHEDEFEDITSIIVEFLLSLDLGILIACKTPTMDVNTANSPLSPASISTEALGKFADTGHALEGDHEIIGLRAMAFRAQVESLESFGQNEYSLLDRLLKTIRDVWERQEREEAKNREEASKIYHFKGLDEVDDDFDPDEAGLEEMFSETVSKQGKHQTKQKTELQTLAHLVSTLHTKIFLSSDPRNADASVLHADFSARLKSFTDGHLVQFDKVEGLVPTMVLELSHAFSWLSREPKIMFNFYKDENPAEVSRIVELISKLRTRLDDLISRWPENDILRDAIEKVQNLMNLPLMTPVNSVLTMLELLHGVIHQWEQVASKEFSLKPYQDTLTELIIGWRKLELQTWPSLFTQEETACSERASMWWFHIHKSVFTARDVSPSDLRPARVALADALDKFMRQSTIGELDSRLSLLEAMESHLRHDPSPNSDGLRSTVLNIWRLHSLFSNQCSEHISKEKLKLERDMKDIILLASWKDTNVNALKEATRRSHYQLYKIVRKYRAVLNIPVSTIANVPDLSKLEKVPLVLDNKIYSNLSGSDMTICALHVKDWGLRPARFLNIASTVSKMQQSYISIAPDIYSSNLMDQLSDSIVLKAQELREATPARLTKDNTAEVRRLQDTKRRAVADALKSLRHMGFKSNISQEEISMQAAYESILGITPALEGTSFEPRIKEIDNMFLTILENLSKTRKVLLNIPADVSAPDLVRGSRYFEHGLSMILRQREVLYSNLKAFDRLRDCLGRFLAFCKDDGFEPRRPEEWSSRFYSEPTLLRVHVGLLFSNIEFAIKIIESEDRFASKDSSDFKLLLSIWKEWAAETLVSLSNSSYTFTGVVTSDQGRLFEATSQRFLEFKNELETFGISDESLRHITNYLLSWIPSINEKLPNTGTQHKSFEKEKIDTIDKKLQEICDTVLSLVQPSFKADGIDKIPEKSIRFEHDKLLRSRIFRDQNLVAQHLESFGGNLRDAKLGDGKSVKALMRLMTPILIEYETICKRDLQQRLDFHHALCRLTHILSNFVISIGTNGFCAPSESSGEAGSSGQLESGTGLGDGDGDEDISNDIAPDEDLSELANQENEDKTKKQNDPEDNAIENDDVDGVSESGSEESDNDADGEEGKEDNMDDEMGKVDESHGLDSLDKDFWDNAEEEAKDEVGTETKGQKKEDGTSNQEEQKKQDNQSANDTQGVEENSPDDLSESHPEDESDAVEQKNNETMNETVPEVERLDISDDFQLDDAESIEEEDQGESDMSEDHDDPLNEHAEGPLDVNDIASEMEDADETDDIQTKKPEEDDDSMENESGEDQDEQPGDLGKETAEEAKEAVPEDSNIKTGGENSSAPATTTENMELNNLGESSSYQEMERDDMEESGQENMVPNATNGQGESGKSEYRPGQGSSDPQSNEQRLENGLRKLGDLLEKVHRTPMDIMEAESRAPWENSHTDEENAQTQFEHMGEDDGQQSTQALGAATFDEAHTIDESMVIESTANVSEPVDGTGEQNVEIPDTKDIDGDTRNEQPTVQETNEEAEEMPIAPHALKKDHEDTMDLDVPVFAQDSKNAPVDAMEIDEVMQESPSSPNFVTNPTTSTPYTKDAQSLWRLYESKTTVLSLSLTEQLRLILEPTLSTKLRGDYRTGKRLNMKRIIPYIASDYKKDKIWMRRTKPSKRQYQVMISLDDSKSMSEPRCVELTFESIALVARALSHLEVGQISVVSFGETTKLVHPFELPFNSHAGAMVFSEMTFSQTKTNIKSLIETSIRLFREARLLNQQTDLWQLELIISDGICEDHKEIQRLVRLAHFEKIVLIFVIIDATGGTTSADGSKGKGSSILDMKEAIFVDQGEGKGSKLIMSRYMDTFPFSYYLIIRRIEDLPGMLSTALRQWFTQTAESGG